MNKIKILNDSYKKAAIKSKHIKINHSKIEEIIQNINNQKPKHWLDSNPFEILDMDLEFITNFLLIYHTIGDYCFWGDPKWQIETKKCTIDGSYAMMYIILNHLYTRKTFEFTYDEFKKLLQANVEIPLLEDRYKNLKEMKQILKIQNNSFYHLTKTMVTDEELLNFIIANFPYFNDEATYKGKKVYFYKRAQLLTSDLLHIKHLKTGVLTDTSNLIGCADYKIPQVMRCYGILEFDHELAHYVDNLIEIPENSDMEIEIRANCLEVINLIYEKTNHKYTKMEINDFMWLLGQDKTKMTKPYHRTLTNHY